MMTAWRNAVLYTTSRGSVSAANFAWASSRMPFTPRVRIFEKSGVQFCECRIGEVANTTHVYMMMFFGSGPISMKRVSSGKACKKLVA